MRALAQGFCLLCAGSISSSFSVVINIMTEPWNRHANNDDNRLDLIYFLIVAIQGFGIMLVWRIAPDSSKLENVRQSSGRDPVPMILRAHSGASSDLELSHLVPAHVMGKSMV